MYNKIFPYTRKFVAETRVRLLLTSFRINPKPAPNKRQRLKADFLFLNIREVTPSSFISNLRYTEQKHPDSIGIQPLGYKKILLYLLLLYIKTQAIPKKREYKPAGKQRVETRGRLPFPYHINRIRPQITDRLATTPLYNH